MSGKRKAAWLAAEENRAPTEEEMPLQISDPKVHFHGVLGPSLRKNKATEIIDICDIIRYHEAAFTHMKDKAMLDVGRQIEGDANGELFLLCS